MQRNIVVIRMYFVSLSIMKECCEIISIFYFYNYVKTIEKLFICTVLKKYMYTDTRTRT